MRELKFRAWHETARDYSKGKSSNVFQWIEEGQPIVLEQYTGLKDKNGVEIYEGDICNGYNYFWDENREIGFNCLGAVCSIFDSSQYSFDIKTQYEIEVIGNIRQNPELLEDK